METKPYIAYLGLGSNLGDRLNLLKSAVDKLNQMDGITVTKKSSLFETKPVGYTDQPDFLNSVIEIQTTFSPNRLLQNCLKIERELDRKREIHWGPRTVDIDVLLIDDQIIEREHLTVPHPRLHERAFVVVPLAEIAPELIHPQLKCTIQSLADALKQDENQEINRIGDFI